MFHGSDDYYLYVLEIASEFDNKKAEDLTKTEKNIAKILEEEGFLFISKGIYYTNEKDILELE